MKSCVNLSFLRKTRWESLIIPLTDVHLFDLIDIRHQAFKISNMRCELSVINELGVSFL